MESLVRVLKNSFYIKKVDFFPKKCNFSKFCQLFLESFFDFTVSRPELSESMVGFSKHRLLGQFEPIWGQKSD